MAPKQTRHRSHPEFRQRSQLPLPAMEQAADPVLSHHGPGLEWLDHGDLA